MWNQKRANRLIDEREKIREHALHVNRLKKVKPSLEIQEPKTPTFMQFNYKKILKENGKFKKQMFNFLIDRKNEIQKQNRQLLKKLLKIDMNPSSQIPDFRQSITPQYQSNRPKSTQNGRNMYSSSQKFKKVKELEQIAYGNQIMLKKIQETQSKYKAKDHQKNYQRTLRLKSAISKNSDRYCKNPYFIYTIPQFDQANFNTLPSKNKSLIQSKASIQPMKNQQITTISQSNFNSDENLVNIKQCRPQSAPKHKTINQYRSRKILEEEDTNKPKFYRNHMINSNEKLLNSQALLGQSNYSQSNIRTISENIGDEN